MNHTNEHDMINESLKNFLVSLGIIAGIGYGVNKFHNDKHLSGKSIDAIVNDINSKPTTEESTFISEVKARLISDIDSEEKLSENEKKKVINTVKDINIVFVSSEHIAQIAEKKDVVGVYFNYTFDGKRHPIIVVDREKFKIDADPTVFHELRHLVDDALSDKGQYSEYAEITSLLDKDIISGSELGKKKLKAKIELYVDNHTGVKVSQIKPKKRAEYIKARNKVVNSLLWSMEDGIEYRSSPSEFYVRFHGLKKWMIDNCYLKDMNDTITQEKLIKVFNDPNASKAFFDFKIDFFEILFYLNVDMTGKTKSDVSKANSIVANYTDFKNNYNA